MPCCYPAIVRSIGIPIGLVTGLAALVACSSPPEGECASPTGSVCNDADLISALASAGPGDRVVVGACQIEGAFTVPAGVRLEGVRPQCSRLAGNGGTPIVTLSEDTALTNLTVEILPTAVCPMEGLDARCEAAIRGTGSGTGSVELSELRIVTPVGAGAVIGSFDSVTLRSVVFEGGLDPTEPVPMPSEPSPLATVGLSMEYVRTVDIDDLRASGFKGVAVALAESRITWARGQIFDNAGSGIILHRGSTVTIDSVTIANTRPLGILAGVGFQASNSDVTASNLDVSGGGIAHHSDDGSHSGSYSFVRVHDNPFRGAELAHLNQIRVTDSSFNATSGTLLGDGLVIFRAPRALVLERVEARRNDRVGIFIDLLGETVGEATVSDVVVESEGDALGFIVQNGTLPGGDTGVTRLGTAEANDAAFVGPLE